MWPGLSIDAYMALAEGNCTVTSRISASTRVLGRQPDILDWSDWKIDYDATSATYAKGSATFTDATLWSGDLSDVLSPYGSELTIERGLVLVDELGEVRREWIPMGVFVITDVEDDPTGTGPITVTLADRTTYIADVPFDAATTTKPTERVVDAIYRYLTECPRIVNRAVGWQDSTGSTAMCPKIDLQRDRLAAVHKLADSINAEFFFDRLGNAVLRPIRTVAESPVVWDIRDGESGSFISAKRTVTRNNTFSRVYAAKTLKENASGATPAKISAVSIDMDPTSPTYHPDFGRTRTYRSPLLTTVAQCQAYADRIRAQSVEAGYTLEVTHLPMEALDRGDVCRITPREGGARQLQLVESFSVGGLASAGPQTLGSRGISLPPEEEQDGAA